MKKVLLAGVLMLSAATSLAQSVVLTENQKNDAVLNICRSLDSAIASASSMAISYSAQGMTAEYSATLALATKYSGDYSEMQCAELLETAKELTAKKATEEKAALAKSKQYCQSLQTQLSQLDRSVSKKIGAGEPNALSNWRNDRIALGKKWDAAGCDRVLRSK